MGCWEQSYALYLRISSLANEGYYTTFVNVGLKNCTKIRASLHVVIQKIELEKTAERQSSQLLVLSKELANFGGRWRTQRYVIMGGEAPAPHNGKHRHFCSTQWRQREYQTLICKRALSIVKMSVKYFLNSFRVELNRNEKKT